MNALANPHILRLGLVAMGALLATGCGEGTKEAASKPVVLAAADSKGGVSDVVRASMLTTAVYGGESQKSTSSIGPGQTLSGQLTASDGTDEDGRYFDNWVFVLGESARVRITQRSGEIDSFLQLLDGAVPQATAVLASNDDWEGLDSRIEAGLKAGSYTIVSTTFDGGTGSYDIGLEILGSGADGGSRALSSGSSVESSLTPSDDTLGDGSHFQDWSYTGSVGERITVSMTSSEFDTYLIVASGEEHLVENDDFDGTDSRVSFTLPASGTYTIRANSYGGGETGSYTLRLDSEGIDAGFDGFGSGGDPNGRYALLVGIDDYPGMGSDLRGPVEDARIMERILIDRFGFDPANVVTLNDSDATRSNIAQGIVQHLGQAGPDGVAVFFYSGHGTQIGENIGLTGPLDPEPRGDGDEGIYIYGHTSESSVILDEELGFLIESLNANRALVVVDACFSGEITRASGDAPQSKVVDLNDAEIADNLRLPTSFITNELKALDLLDMSLGFGDLDQIEAVFRNPQRHLAWGSSTEDQVSWTSNLGNGASLFTYYVGERMMEAPGSMTFGELQELVHDDAVQYIERDGNMTMQNASMRGPIMNMTLDDFFRQR